MKKTGLCAVMMAAGQLLAAGGVRAQFSALPGVVRLDASDSARVAVVQVRNEGQSDQQFSFYFGDYDQDERGEFSFQAFGVNARSCSGRATVFPDNAVLHPGERQELRIHIAPGPTCWSLLFIQSAAGKQGQVRVAQRIGVRVLNVPASLTREAEIDQVAARSDGDSIRVDVHFRNLGQAPIELKGRIEIRAIDGRTLRTAEVGPLGVLPGHDRSLAVPVADGLPSGRYLAVPILDFGGQYLAGGQVVFRNH